MVQHKHNFISHFSVTKNMQQHNNKSSNQHTVQSFISIVHHSYPPELLVGLSLVFQHTFAQHNICELL